jgi:glucosamine 6-phosphate synthetase-like amidotransferase/phosphosugar isomerase protein
MCGIAAILLNPQERSTKDWQAIRSVFTQNLLSNEARGRAATGLALLCTDGRAMLFKRPLPPSQFVGLKEYRVLLNTIGSQTTLILGHTRMPTKGSPANNYNNHPLKAGPVFGVHNGHIENDDELFCRFSLPRQGEVDSEIIFRLLETVSPAALNGSYLSTIQPLLQLLKGQFTFLACDQRLPERLLVLKHNNPLCVHFHPEWNALIFSSRYIFLRQAFGRSLTAEALEHDRLMQFDARLIPQQGAQPVWSLKLENEPNQVS